MAEMNDNHLTETQKKNIKVWLESIGNHAVTQGVSICVVVGIDPKEGVKVWGMENFPSLMHFQFLLKEVIESGTVKNYFH